MIFNPNWGGYSPKSFTEGGRAYNVLTSFAVSERGLR